MRTLTVEIVLKGHSGAELRRREQALRRAIKTVPGRDTLTILEGLAVMLECQADGEGARAVSRSVEALKDLRCSARGGDREQPPPSPTAGCAY